MSETKQGSSLKFIWELGWYIILILVLVGLPFLKYGTSYQSSVYLFLNQDSIFFSKSFQDILNAYFINSFILLVVLPVVSYFIHYFLVKKGYLFLASLQSFLMYISCALILIYAMASLTVDKEYFGMDSGFYACLFLFLVHIYIDWRHLKQLIETRNPSTEENPLAELPASTKE